MEAPVAHAAFSDNSLVHQPVRGTTSHLVYEGSASPGGRCAATSGQRPLTHDLHRGAKRSATQSSRGWVCKVYGCQGFSTGVQNRLHGACTEHLAALSVHVNGDGPLSYQQRIQSQPLAECPAEQRSCRRRVTLIQPHPGALGVDSTAQPPAHEGSDTDGGSGSSQAAGSSGEGSDGDTGDSRRRGDATWGALAAEATAGSCADHAGSAASGWRSGASSGANSDQRTRTPPGGSGAGWGGASLAPHTRGVAPEEADLSPAVRHAILTGYVLRGLETGSRQGVRALPPARMARMAAGLAARMLSTRAAVRDDEGLGGEGAALMQQESAPPPPPPPQSCSAHQLLWPYHPLHAPQWQLPDAQRPHLPDSQQRQQGSQPPAPATWAASPPCPHPGSPSADWAATPAPCIPSAAQLDRLLGGMP